MYFRKKKAPDTAVGKLDGIGMPVRVILKECPVFILSQDGALDTKNSFQNKSNLRKERGKLKCHFLQQQ